MEPSTDREQSSTYLIVLWLPFAGAMLAAAGVYFSAGAYGFDLLWIRWTPTVVGFLVFVALFAVLAIFFLLRGLFRFIHHTATKNYDSRK
jgi:hypothetical protein